MRDSALTNGDHGGMERFEEDGVVDEVVVSGGLATVSGN